MVLDYVQMAIQRLIGFGKKEEFKEILAILRRQNDFSFKLNTAIIRNKKS